MRSWKLWRSIEKGFSSLINTREGRRELLMLDLALLVTLLPLLLVLKLPMLFFLIVVGGLLIRRRSVGTGGLLAVAMLGIVALLLSMYGVLGFAGLGRFQVFLELMLNLLVLAVALQRLTRRIDRYLLLSPLLFLLLSLFFFKSLGMLLYLPLEIFLLLWIVLSRQMPGGGGIEALRMAARLFVLSLPAVVLLFLFFPRVSFGEGRFGFQGERIARTGHDGTMYVDGRAALIPSDRIVMELEFEEGIPRKNLYLRGSVLYRDLGDRWEPLPPSVPRAFAPGSTFPSWACGELADPIRYRVKLYPTRRRWLYLLDLPASVPKGANIDADFVVISAKPVEKIRRYRGESFLKYRCGEETEPAVLEAALAYRKGENPRSLEKVRAIRERYRDPQRRLQAITRLFRDANLTYTLDPGGLDTTRIADDLLFGKRRGYCVHFSAAFVRVARMAGIPARVVTGYMVSGSEGIERYLAVRERDAHAWSEVYLDGAWRRIDPTAWASRVELPNRREAVRDRPVTQEWRRWELYGLYWRYRVEEWVLRYDYLRRLRLIETLRTDSVWAAKFFGGVLLFVAAAVGLFLYWRRPGCRENRLYCRLQPLLRCLERKGCLRKRGETVGNYLERCGRGFAIGAELHAVAEGYYRARYAGKREEKWEEALKRARRACRRLGSPGRKSGAAGAFRGPDAQEGEAQSQDEEIVDGPQLHEKRGKQQ